MTASLGNYNEQQTLLDITQGSRVPRVDYSPREAPALRVAANGVVSDWRAILRRARSADASIEPGLLAASLPGGAGYAGSGTSVGIDALLAAGRDGRVARVSLGTSGSLPGRVAALLARRSLVVADLPGGAVGLHQLGALLAARPQSELLLVLERPPKTAAGAVRPPVLLALAAAGIGSRRAALTTATTRTDGLVTASDLAPTILTWLSRRGPSQFTGQPISAGAPRSLAWFAAFERRLSVIQGRRTSVLLAFLAAWLALLAVTFAGRRELRQGLRLGGLAALWAPSTALLAAALEPTAVIEIVLVVGGAFALALVSDRLAPWPRAAAIPVAAMLVLYTVDLACGSALIETSLIGSDPISGSRFFGVGNELSALLPVALLTGLAAALPQRPARQPEIVVVAVAGAVLTLLVAWGRLGANVGAIFTIGGATAIATVLLAPGGLSRRRLLLAAIAVLGALGLLALLDLASGGGAHFTREVLHAHSLSALLDTLRRRLSEAWDELLTGAIPVAVAVCLALAAVLVVLRRRLLAPVGSANAWGACLGGGLAGSLLGSIADDSGPRVLLVGCVTLGCVLAYLRGAPPGAAPSSGPDPDSPAPQAFLSDA
jgi:hypothetical protein